MAKEWLSPYRLALDPYKAIKKKKQLWQVNLIHINLFIKG